MDSQDLWERKDLSFLEKLSEFDKAEESKKRKREQESVSKVKKSKTREKKATNVNAVESVAGPSKGIASKKQTGGAKIGSPRSRYQFDKPMRKPWQVKPMSGWERLTRMYGILRPKSKTAVRCAEDDSSDEESAIDYRKKTDEDEVAFPWVIEEKKRRLSLEHKGDMSPDQLFDKNYIIARPECARCHCRPCQCTL